MRRKLRGRSAGLISGANSADIPRTIPDSANFTTDTREAFWQVGDTLAWTSGAQVLRDARLDQGISGGTVGWTEALIDRIRAAARRLLGGNYTIPPVESNGRMSRDFLKLVLWVTYSSGGAHPVLRPSDILLPVAITLPQLNRDYGGLSPNHPVTYYPGVTGPLFNNNPFAQGSGGSSVSRREDGVYQHDEIDVSGGANRNENTGRKPYAKSSSGLVLAIAGLAIVAASAGSGDK